MRALDRSTRTKTPATIARKTLRPQSRHNAFMHCEGGVPVLRRLLPLTTWGWMELVLGVPIPTESTDGPMVRKQNRSK